MVAVLSGATALIAGGILVANHFRGASVEALLEDKELSSLKKELCERPKDEALKGRIRTRDWELRNNLFGRLHFDDWGTTFLLCAIVVLLISATYAGSLRRKLPNPLEWGAREPGEERRLRQISRHALAGVALLTGGFLLALGLGSSGMSFAGMMDEVRAARGPGGGGADVGKKPGGGTSARKKGLFPSKEEVRSQWPRFRGPGGCGVYMHGKVATEWDAASGKNILWKTPVPLDGYSSPIVWKKRVFLTGATSQKREVYCFDAAEGSLLWKADVGEVARRSPEVPDVFEAPGHAACTPVTDGRHVYAIYANGDVVAFDYEGKRVWARNLGLPDDTYGHASSLTMWCDLVLVEFDHAGEGASGSALYALDAATGGEVWRVARDYGATWTSPIVIETKKGDQFITATTPFVVANDPETGVELWKASVLEGEVAPSPVFAGGMVLVAMSECGLAAIRPGGKGDVTDTGVLWHVEGTFPETGSPVSDGKLVWTITTEGLLTCLRVEDGVEAFKKETEYGGYSSPCLAGGRLYVTGGEGATVVLKAGEAYEEVGKGKVGEKVAGSLAFAEGRILIRGEKHLFCIGGKASDAKKSADERARATNGPPKGKRNP
jgi:outer membrane protein assembly factor BamB